MRIDARSFLEKLVLEKSSRIVIKFKEDSGNYSYAIYVEGGKDVGKSSPLAFIYLHAPETGYTTWNLSHEYFKVDKVLSQRLNGGPVTILLSNWIER